jgi:hypothetical protein
MVDAGTNIVVVGSGAAGLSAAQAAADFSYCEGIVKGVDAGPSRRFHGHRGWCPPASREGTREWRGKGVPRALWGFGRRRRLARSDQVMASVVICRPGGAKLLLEVPHAGAVRAFCGGAPVGRTSAVATGARPYLHVAGSHLTQRPHPETHAAAGSKLFLAFQHARRPVSRARRRRVSVRLSLDPPRSP